MFKNTKTFIYLFLDTSSTWWTATWGAQAACNTSKWSDVKAPQRGFSGKIKINKIDPPFFLLIDCINNQDANWATSIISARALPETIRCLQYKIYLCLKYFFFDTRKKLDAETVSKHMFTGEKICFGRRKITVQLLNQFPTISPVIIRLLCSIVKI